MRLSIERIMFNLISIVTLLINAFLFIPVFAYGVVKKEKDLIIYAALFFAIFSTGFTPPFEFDLYRHYEAYEFYCKYGEPLYLTKDIYLLGLTYVGCQLGQSKDIIYFVSALIYYVTIFYILRTIFKEPGWLFTKLSIAIIVFFTNSLVEISGLRFTTGLAFSYLYLLSLSRGEMQIKQFAFLFFAIFSHFSMAILLVVHIIFKYFNFFKTSKHHIMFVTFFMLFGLFLVRPIIGEVLVQFQNLTGFYIGAETYTTGEWGADRLDVQKFNKTGVLVEQFKLYFNITVTWFSLILFSCFIKQRSSTYYLLVCCTIILFVFIPFDTVYFRYQLFTILLSVLLLFEQRYVFQSWLMLLLLSLQFARLFLQYAIGFLSSYKIFLNEVFTVHKVFDYSFFYYLIK